MIRDGPGRVRFSLPIEGTRFRRVSVAVHRPSSSHPYRGEFPGEVTIRPGVSDWNGTCSQILRVMTRSQVARLETRSSRRRARPATSSRDVKAQPLALVVYPSAQNSMGTYADVADLHPGWREEVSR